jgi:hypothetical protein
MIWMVLQSMSTHAASQFRLLDMGRHSVLMVNGFVLRRQRESACLTCMIGEENAGEGVL